MLGQGNLCVEGFHNWGTHYDSQYCIALHDPRKGPRPCGNHYGGGADFSDARRSIVLSRGTTFHQIPVGSILDILPESV